MNTRGCRTCRHLAAHFHAAVTGVRPAATGAYLPPGSRVPAAGPGATTVPGRLPQQHTAQDKGQLSLMPGRSAHRARRAPQASGHVDHERQLIWGAELGNQAFERLAQVRDCRIEGVPLAIGSHTGTQLSVSAPHATRRLTTDAIGRERSLGT